MVGQSKLGNDDNRHNPSPGYLFWGSGLFTLGLAEEEHKEAAVASEQRPDSADREPRSCCVQPGRAHEFPEFMTSSSGSRAE